LMKRAEGVLAAGRVRQVIDLFRRVKHLHAKGKSFSPQIETEPNAEGSVHPYSTRSRAGDV